MSDKVRRGLIGVLVIVFCIAAVFLGRSLWEYHKGEKIYESAMEFVIETKPSVKADEADSEEREETKERKPYTAPVSNVKRTHANIDFAGLQAINADVFGWIQILGTQVDYPLIDADDNHYYLNHSYDLRRSSYGSIFLEPRNSPKMNEKHVVIYGHNMVNKSMFGSLINYKNQDYANSHNTITICLPGRDLTYRVFSAYTAHVDSATYRMTFGGEESFNEMISYMKENSMIRSDITPKEGEQILTLSTCTPAGAREYRFVVNAVLINGNKQADAPVIEEKKIEPVAIEPAVQSLNEEASAEIPSADPSLTETATEGISAKEYPEETSSE